MRCNSYAAQRFLCAGPTADTDRCFHACCHCDHVRANMQIAHSDVAVGFFALPPPPPSFFKNHEPLVELCLTELSIFVPR